ncbi:MAG TPA: response regulator transcription factor [Capsulimonadaceae bacterium]|jgi:two-component system response regulator CpxR
MDRLLAIDDDVELCEMLAEYLEAEGWIVDSVHDGDKAVDAVSAKPYAMVVLDVMLPGLGGFEILRRIRAQSRVPVIMLTARGTDLDRILGLELGADDYLAKPFNPRELAARIRAVQRRSAAPKPEAPARETLSVDDVEIDLGSRTVTRGSIGVELTGVEYNALETLMRAAGKVTSREELVRKALGRRLQPYDRSIDMHISNLRRKLGALPDGRERIKTIRGSGYFYATTGDHKP